MKSTIIAFSFALLLSGVAFGHGRETAIIDINHSENLAVDTLKRQISQAWNSKVLWEANVTIDAFEKEAIGIRKKVDTIIKKQPLNAFENNKYADFTELFRRKVYVQGLNDQSAVPNSFYKILDVVDVNNALLGKLGSAELTNFINAYLAMEHYHEGKAQPTFFEESKYVLNHLKDENVKSAYLEPKVFSYNRYNMIDSTMMDLIKDINRLSKDEKFKRKVNENYAFYSSVTAGKTVADFRLPDQNDKIVKLSDYKGKAVIIDMWATWCSSCVANLPYFEAIADEFKDQKDVVFINIAWENEGDKSKWLKFLTDRKLHGVQLIAERSVKDGIDKQDGLKEKFSLTGIPRYIFIDKQGRIVESFGPYPSKTGFKELVLKTIAKT